MSPKIARIGFFSSLALLVLSLVVPLTIAMVSLVDGERAGEIAAADSMRQQMATQGILARNFGRLDYVAPPDWDAHVVALAAKHAAQEDVPSVKMTEAIFPWVPVAGFIIFFISLFVFGVDRLFFLSDEKYQVILNETHQPE